MRESAIGIYVSVPFCRSKCTFCNFASGVFPAGEHTRYVDRLIEDMEAAAGWAAGIGLHLPREVDSIYLGGGTPSLLEPELISRLFGALRSHFDVQPEAEVTMECAPGQLAQPVLDAMVAAGVNRVSLGVQSFVDAEAQGSGRLHSRAVVVDDLRRLRAAGIQNLNLDLIAGVAGQTLASWDESLQVLLDCGAPHASVYMLEVDEDSRLGREMLAGGARYRAGLVPSDEAIARMYETAVTRLESDGLRQYEISNFARTGAESRHNLRYWERRPYLGLGLDASSMLPASEGEEILRSTTTDDLKSYLAGPEGAQTEWIGAEGQLEEAWFLGLRKNSGVDAEALVLEFGEERTASSLETARRLADEGLLTWGEGCFRLTPRGRMISNEVFEQFLQPAETRA